MEAVATKENSVLFVDDEPRVLTSMRAMFRRDYNVFLANSGEEALDFLRRQPVDVVVSDQRMPGMTGVDVLREIKSIAPRTMRILLTGYADLKAIEDSINDAEVFRYLMKPCPSDDLKEAVALAANVANGVFDAGDGFAGDSPATESGGEAAARHVDDTEGHVAEVFGLAARGSEASEEGVRAATGSVPVDPDSVEVLVLSRDRTLKESLTDALGERRKLHHVESIPDAVAALESRPIGVLVTDTAVDEKEVARLTAQLKAFVPELVTVIASDRSDAQALITMINYGQIFRFLLKPVQIAQCRLWMESAINKHVELTRDPSQVRRHRVKAPQPEGRSDERILGAMRDRIKRIRGRLFQSSEAG